MKRCLNGFPHHSCHPDWRADGEPPLSRSCQRDAGSIPGQVPLRARMPREAEEHSRGKTYSSFAPVFHHCTDMPNHPLKPRLCTMLYRSFFGSAHMHTAMWGWIPPVLASVLEKNSYWLQTGKNFTHSVQSQIRKFSAAGILCRQPWATAEAWRDSRPAHLLAALIATWHFQRLVLSPARLVHPTTALQPHTEESLSLQTPPRLHGRTAIYCRFGQQRKE